MIPPRRLASAGAALFCTIVSSAHNPPLVILPSLTSYFTVLGLVARVLFRLAPVAQHLPAWAVREEEVELGRFPHRPLQIERSRLRSQALEEEAVCPFFAAADE